MIRIQNQKNSRSKIKENSFSDLKNQLTFAMNMISFFISIIDYQESLIVIEHANNVILQKKENFGKMNFISDTIIHYDLKIV